VRALPTAATVPYPRATSPNVSALGARSMFSLAISTMNTTALSCGTPPLSRISPPTADMPET
jgi:hypothetical protein